MPLRRPPQPGFTLIELILVLAIIGAMLAVVAPSLGRLRGKTQVADTAGQLRAMAEFARGRAVADGRPCRMVIDTTDHLCWIEQLDAGGFTRPTSSLGKKVELDPTVSITTDALDQSLDLMTLRMEPDGRAEVAQFILVGKEGRTLVVYTRSMTEPYRIGDIEDASLYAQGGGL